MASQPDAGELRDELKAHLRARQELSEEMEDEVVESFLGKIEESINQRVEERVDEALGRRKRFESAARIYRWCFASQFRWLPSRVRWRAGWVCCRLWSLP